MKYYVSKIDRNVGKSEIIDVLDCKNVKEARAIATGKYINIITSGIHSLQVVSERAHKQYQV